MLPATPVSSGRVVVSLLLNFWGRQKSHVEKYELIARYESAKLPVYIPKRKVEAQPLIRSTRSGSPGAER
jgi:hypothetical protein